MKKYLHPVSRALVALIFLLSGFGKIMMFKATEGMMASAGIPLTRAALIAAILLELGGGALLLLGFKTRPVSFLLLGFLILVTWIFHASHIGDPAQGTQQMVETLKNLAIMGGLLKFAADGAGQTSLDSRETLSESTVPGGQQTAPTLG